MNRSNLGKLLKLGMVPVSELIPMSMISSSFKFLKLGIVSVRLLRNKYSNFNWDEGRIETWDEVVTRAVDALRYLSNNLLTDSIYQRMFELIYTHDIMPSMRLLSMPIEAIKRDNSVIYNCCAGICDTPKVFSEAQFLSMSGVGLTWSVESKNVNKLPEIKPFTNITTYSVIEDSQIGWANSTDLLIHELYDGRTVDFDYSLIRPSGSPLKTKGGHASGPEPLIELHKFIKEVFFNAQGRKLTTLEVHDLMCYALESGISGGVRRAAGACLFDKDDADILNCKYDGSYTHPTHKVRSNANNSLVWTGKISMEDIDNLTAPWVSGSGEPNFFKRDNAQNTSPKHREFIEPENISSNPCFEIYLSPISSDSKVVEGGGWQFCNLSTINVRPDDTIQQLEEKTYYATLIGDIQSTATNFQYIRSGSKIICDKDRLLGVNLVGYSTAPIMRSSEVMLHLKEVARTTDEQFSKQFNVPISAAIGSVAPKGNGSVFSFTGAGMNALHSQYQIRNVTVNRNSGMHNFLESQNVPHNDYPGRDYASMFTFPIKYPDGCLTLDNQSAIDQLEVWRTHKLYWCDHNPSCSITYTADEIPAIKNWLYDNQNIIGGIAFFPKYESTYTLLPIVPINEEKYKQIMDVFPVIDWTQYNRYEISGTDERQKVMECSGGACEIQW